MAHITGKANVTFDDKDIELIDYLANQFNDTGNRRLLIEEPPHYSTWSPEELRRRIDRFAGFQMIELLRNDHLDILPSLLEVDFQLKNEPPTDYWKRCDAWFRARWWSLPVLAVAVVLPLIVQWIEMIKEVLTWIGVLV